VPTVFIAVVLNGKSVRFDNKADAAPATVGEFKFIQ